MVFEEILEAKWIKKKPIYALFLGVIFPLISYFTSLLLFRNTPSFIPISTLLFTVLITLPTLNNLLSIEEKSETRKRGLFRYKTMINFFVYFFIGSFMIFFLIGLINPSDVFSKEDLHGATENVEITINQNLPPPPPTPTHSQVLSIAQNNLYVMIIAFILSLFYGAGALFLIVLNASVFASALANIVLTKVPQGFLYTYSFVLCNLGIMFFHMIPEVASYLLAAIAGGMLSKAFTQEKFWSKRFKSIGHDSLKLLVIAYVVLLLAAIIEVTISKQLFTSNVCVESRYWVIFAFVLTFIVLILVDIFRKFYNK